jgi:hypothetical protein
MVSWRHLSTVPSLHRNSRQIDLSSRPELRKTAVDSSNAAIGQL